MRELECRRDLPLCGVRRVLIQLEVFDCDFERRGLEFVSQSLQHDVRRKKFLVEDDLEFFIGWPVLRWLEK